jgi:purine nucleosidase
MRIHLDTDIGDDIDDAFCVALMLASPELELASVSTVAWDTAQRAQIVNDYLRVADKQVPVVAGLDGTLSSKPDANLLKRKQHYTARGSGPVLECASHLLPTLAAARESCEAIFTIGSLTNLAFAMAHAPMAKFPKVMAMAGEFQRGSMVEWNIYMDPEAASVVCRRADLEIDFIPWTIGYDTRLDDADHARLAAAKTPLAKLLIDHLAEFSTGRAVKREMYDPMTVVATLAPELFTWQRGRVSVDLRSEHAFGLTTFKADANGPHRWASAVDAPAAKKWMLDRLCD